MATAAQVESPAEGFTVADFKRLNDRLLQVRVGLTGYPSEQNTRLCHISYLVWQNHRLPWLAFGADLHATGMEAHASGQAKVIPTLAATAPIRHHIDTNAIGPIDNAN